MLPRDCTVLWFSLKAENLSQIKLSQKSELQTLLLRLQTFFSLCSGTFSTMFCIASLSSPKKVAVDKTVKLVIWGLWWRGLLKINTTTFQWILLNFLSFILCTYFIKSASAAKTCWLCVMVYQMVCKPAARETGKIQLPINSSGTALRKLWRDIKSHVYAQTLQGKSDTPLLTALFKLSLLWANE